VYGAPGFRPSAVAAAGDADGDAVPDFLVGASANGSSALGPGGAARLYSGATGALLWTVGGTTLNDGFGQALDGVGDVNGDGLSDVVVSTVLPPGSSQPGYVRAFSGATGALLWQRVGSYAAHRLGYSVAGAGDVNGDGVPDVIAGAIGDHTFGFNNGAAYVYDGATGATLRTFVGAAGGHRLGYSVDGVGDMNGDGFAETIVGTFRTNGAGYARVYDGATGALRFETVDPNVAAHYGHTVASAGDWNGDGVPDVIVSGPDATIGTLTGAGYVKILSGIDGATIRRFDGTTANRPFGFALGGAGDLDGDGLPEAFATGISASAPGLLVALGRHGARPYGAASGGGVPCDLSWFPGPPTARAAGALVGVGPPSAPALLGASLGAGFATLGGVDVLIALDEGAWLALPTTLDGAGGLLFSLDLRAPALSGIALRLQLVAADASAPLGLSASRGLELLFGA